MEKEKTRGEKLLGKAQEAPAAPVNGVSAPKGIKKILGELRGIFTKSPGKNKGPAGIVGPAFSRKPPLSKMLDAFSLQKLDLKFINQLLIAVLAGLVILTFFVIFRKRPDVSSVKAAVSKINFTEIEPQKITIFQNVAYFLEQAEVRDIFNIFVEKKEPVIVVPVEPVEQPPPPPPPKVPIADKVRHLKLIGISWGTDPKAIIRDDKTQEVHFVGEGETIQGTEVSVKEILKDEVILFSEDDTMSLL